MPPRAVGRRTSSRLASAQPDESLSSSPSDALPSLSRPNLPRLAGTPASRRQYTYGSAAEPPPSRPGRGIRMDQPLDLGRAVDNALSRQEREDQASSRKQMPPPPRPIADEDAEDELASEGPPEPEPQTRRPGRPRKAAGQRGSEEPRLGNTGHNTRASASISPAKSRQPTRQQLEDMRDDRSFGTESDYYGNASIRSSPAPTLASTRSSRNTASKRSSNLRQEPLLNAVDETPHAVQQPPQMPPQEDITLETVPPAPNTEPVPLVVQDTRPQDSKFNRRQLRINPRPPSQPAPLLAHDEALPHGATYLEEGASSSFQPANGRPFRPHTSLPPRRRREDPFPSNHSEADDAMQRDIAAAEADGYDTTNLFRRAWAQLTSFASAPDRRPAEGRVRLDDLLEDDDLGHENPSVNWWYLLYPQTYLNFIVKVMDAVNDHFELLWRTVFRMLPSGRVWQRFFSLLAAIACVMFLVVNASTLADVAHSAAASVQSIPRPDVSSSFSGLSDMASKVGDFASSIRIPMPSFGGRKPSIWEELDDAERDELGAYLRKFDADFENLRSASSLHGASIEKLSEILPHIIHVKSSGDKLTIGTDFYYAMRDKLRGDEAVLTFDASRGDYVVDSDKQWQSLVHGISNDPYLDRKLNLSMSSIESRLDGKMTSFWDSWIKDNDDKITAQLGTALESLKAANSEAELDAIVKKLVKDQIRESTADGGTLVTRDDFIKQLHREFKVHRHEIRTELDELQPQLKSLVKETVRLAHIQDAPPAGMTRDDVTTLVSTLIRRAIGDIDLTAMANGKIYAHWDTDLKNQVNYFGVGGGAIADPKLSSTTYDPYNKGLANMAAFARGIRDARPLPHIAALQRWDDEGDCWCAAREVNHRGNPHGATLSVLLAHQVIPQHIVIEHILPGATSDPGARPREIEVHIRIEDPEVLSRVQDFSATHFVERSDDWNYSPAELGSRFVKVGQFTYEGAELHDGVHVQSLSRELVEMGAETDQVVVRAISNYGAKEHTCFYRVRLYGERIGIDV